MDEGKFTSQLYKELKAKGYTDLLSFCRAYPSTTYREMSHMFDLPAMVIMMVHWWEANEHAVTTEYAQDALVRFLREYVRRGWGRGTNAEFNRAGAYAVWVTRLSDCGEDLTAKEKADRVWSALNNLCPDRDWVPKSPADPLIQRAFEHWNRGGV